MEKQTEDDYIYTQCCVDCDRILKVNPDFLGFIICPVCLKKREKEKK